MVLLFAKLCADMDVTELTIVTILKYILSVLQPPSSTRTFSSPRKEML